MKDIAKVDTASLKKIQTKPVIKTTAPSAVTAFTAVCGGEIVFAGISPVLDLTYGICWSTHHSPTTDDFKTSHTVHLPVSSRTFINTMNHLLPNTTYYVRAYAKNKLAAGYGEEEKITTLDHVNDIDGNRYHVVNIGRQVWMVENLRTTKYRDGSAISDGQDNNNLWNANAEGARCFYNNLAGNKDYLGLIYNWKAITNVKNIAPAGWHVPGEGDWKKLVEFLNGNNVAGGKMKTKGFFAFFGDEKKPGASKTALWRYPNTGADNSSGFSALPGGMRGTCGLNDNGENNYPQGAFSQAHHAAFFWSVTETAENKAVIGILRYDRADITLEKQLKEGYYVRCVKDMK